MHYKIFLQLLVFISFCNAAYSTGIIILKSNPNSDLKFAKPVVYKDLYDHPKAPILKVSIGAADRNVSKALVPSYIAIDTLPERVFRQGAKKDTRKPREARDISQKDR